MISSATVRRLAADIKDIMQQPLTDNGIYYSHDDEDLLKGYAMIIGAEDTPYAGGYYFFEIVYPPTYPHAPPTVTYCTNGDAVRFNPNLYVNGKVCVSLLNTWRGEQWTSCQTTRTLLLTLCTLLCADPLLNEPGITRQHVDFAKYDTIVQYKNIEIALLKMFERAEGIYPPKFTMFYSIVREKFYVNGPKAVALLTRLSMNTKAIRVSTGVYHMSYVLDYEQLANRLRVALE